VDDVRRQTKRAVHFQLNPVRHLSIFAHRIGEASAKFSRDYTRILGPVVAHELGHVLLPAATPTRA